MADSDAPASPLETAVGAAGQETAEAFGLLGNETRLAILVALWEAYDPHASENAVHFSELRERVGMRDSGQFNYHLRKLGGLFVESTDAGYALRPVGLQLVQTVVAGTGREATLGPTVIDVACHLCAAPTTVAYEEGWLFHRCTECRGSLGHLPEYGDGTLFGEPFSPAALAGRSAEEVFAAGVFRLLSVMTMKLGGLCPRCSGVVESTPAVCEAHDGGAGDPCSACGRMDEVRVRWVCTVCKYRGGGSPPSLLITHPAVVAFYHDHGVDLGYTVNEFEAARQVVGLMRSHEGELLSTDPLRVRVTVRHGGDELRLTLDEHLDVVEVSAGD